jgi:hypothetical protein
MKQSDVSMKRDVVVELHAPARVNFKRRRVIVKGLKDLLQSDLIEMIPYARFNNGFKYILIVINTFSKFVWAYPLKTKTAAEVTNALSSLFKTKKNIPKNFQTDFGKEFYNKSLNAVFKKYHINHYSTYSTKKAQMAERVIRTIKNLIWKEFSFRGNYKWTDILQDIVKRYNNTKHHTTQYKPSAINKKNEKKILRDVYSHMKTIDPHKSKFKVGDFVRVSKYRQVFSKSYTPNWSNEIFSIKKVQQTVPRTYLLQDEDGEPILGGFYAYELQRVKHPNFYLIEKILRKKGNKYYVKWLGMSKRTWINKSDID